MFIFKSLTKALLLITVSAISAILSYGDTVEARFAFVCCPVRRRRMPRHSFRIASGHAPSKDGPRSHGLHRRPGVQASFLQAPLQKVEHRKALPDAFIFPNADDGFMDADNYRFRVLKPLADALGISEAELEQIAEKE